MALPVIAVVVCVLVVTLSPSKVDSQIPAVCTDSVSMSRRECCPDNCGGSRGSCIDITYDRVTTESRDVVRQSWPYYFNRVCSCNGNYWGYDCSRCKYGYYGDNCENKQTLPRKNIMDFTPTQWSDYIRILQRTRTYPSGYKVLLQEPNNTFTQSNFTQDAVPLYKLFIWIHHYVAKDSETILPGEELHTI
jgi:hypothetical protein